MTTNNRLFPVLGASVQNQRILRFNASLYRPVVVLRRQVPGFESLRAHQEQHIMGAALFVLRGFYGAAKEGIRTARAPRFASRGAETPRWGVSRARLGESLRAHQTMKIRTFLDRRRVRIFCFLRKAERGFFSSRCVSETLSEEPYNKSHNCKGAVRQKGLKHEV